MFKNISKLFAISTLTILITACGGGAEISDDNKEIGSGEVPEVRTGVLRDSAISGFSYKSCDSNKANCITGVTNGNGEYQYYSGSQVNFSLGEMNVASAKGQPLISPFELFETEEEAVNFSSFAMGLDEDGDAANGISVSQQTIDLANLSFSGETLECTDREQLEAISNKLNATLVSEVETEKHLEKTLLLERFAEEGDAYALALLNERTYSLGSINLDKFNQSSSVRVKWEIWNDLSYDLLSTDALRTDIEDTEKKRNLADKSLSFVQTAVSAAGNAVAANAALAAGSDFEFYVSGMSFIQNSMSLVLTTTHDGVTSDVTVDLNDNPAMAYAMAGLEIASIGNIASGTISGLQEYSDGEAFVNSAVESLTPVINEIVSQVSSYIASEGLKNGAGAAVKGFVGNLGSSAASKFNMLGLALDGAKILNNLYFAHELMDTRVENEARQMAFDYLKSYYASAGDERWMLQKYGYTSNIGGALATLSQGFQKDWTDYTLEATEEALKTTVLFSVIGQKLLGLEGYEAVDNVRRMQAELLISDFQNRVEEGYQKVSSMFGGIPSDDGQVNLEGREYTLKCNGTTETIAANIKTFGLPWDLDDPNSLKWIVPEGVAYEFVNEAQNSLIASFNQVGVFSIGAQLQKNESLIRHVDYQNYVVMSCVDIEEYPQVIMTNDQADLVTFILKEESRDGFIGWYDASGNLLSSETSYQYRYADYQRIKEIKPVWDSQVPTITLQGDNPVEVEKGQAYQDKGATAQDENDGDLTASIIVGGDTVDTNTVGTYVITYNVSDSAGNAAKEVVRIVNVVAAEVTEQPPVVATGKLNDTGITWGGNYPNGNNADCTGETIEQQDCSSGRDAQAAAGTLTKVGGGEGGFDFTRLNADGSEYSGSGDYASEPWACVRDNHTGLIWEVKTDDGGLHDKNVTYRWGGDTAQLFMNYGDRYDDWNVLVDGTNSANLCGVNNWRVPSYHELLSITDMHFFIGTLDQDFFPMIDKSTTDDQEYWTATPFSDLSFNHAWVLDFGLGRPRALQRDFYGLVRLVGSDNSTVGAR
ncbi:hypothetical protein THIOSC15_1160014 [uncultured Thiomicrorhabdus sp.]